MLYHQLVGCLIKLLLNKYVNKNSNCNIDNKYQKALKLRISGELRPKMHKSTVMYIYIYTRTLGNT